MRYQETGDLAEAAAFATCGASCVVEGIAATTLGDRAEIERRLVHAGAHQRGGGVGGMTASPRAANG